MRPGLELGQFFSSLSEHSYKRYVLLTRTSLSPSSGTGALSSNLSESKPFLPSTFHCLVVEGAMLCMCGWMVEKVEEANSTREWA